MTFGIDIGTTSVSGVAVDAAGVVVATSTEAHLADLPKRAEGVDEQDPQKLFSAVERVRTALEKSVGKPDRIGWTGQMHGVVAVDGDNRALTPFVTWRDARRYGGRVMSDWARRTDLRPQRCLPVTGYVLARLEGRQVIDATFLESWHIEGESFPAAWLPETIDGLMLGDNQAGVFAAQRLVPGCAVVNLGTSGQVSLVVNSESPLPPSSRLERRSYPGGKALLCRASLVGGQALAAVRARLGIGWNELNATAEANREIARALDFIVDDLFDGVDLTGVTGLVGVGNALRLNSCLVRAVERRSGLTCVIPKVTEMAAYGAALYRQEANT